MKLAGETFPLLCCLDATLFGVWLGKEIIHSSLPNLKLKYLSRNWSAIERMIVTSALNWHAQLKSHYYIPGTFIDYISLNFRMSSSFIIIHFFCYNNITYVLRVSVIKVEYSKEKHRWLVIFSTLWKAIIDDKMACYLSWLNIRAAGEELL